MSDTSGLPAICTAHEAADFLRMDYKKVLLALKHGEIPGLRIGHEWRVHRATLEERIRAGDPAA